MKNISNFISENLINEANNLVVAAFNHEDPETTHIICNCSARDIKNLDNVDMDYTYETLKPVDKLLFIMHSDENPMIVGTPDLNKLKKSCWSEYQDDPEYPEFDTLGIGGLSMDEEFKNENDLWKFITSFIEDSEVDGDSSNVYALIDPRKQETVVAGHTDIMFYNDMQDFLSENGFDEED